MSAPTSASVDEVDAAITVLIASWFFDPVTLQHAAEAGIDDPVVLYAAGRAGVMGDVAAPQVHAAFGFFPEGAVAEIWPTVAAHGRPTHIASVYADAMASCARHRWEGGDHLEAAATVARAGRTVADAVVPLGMSLFAGWRALPLPGDPCGDAALTLLALRELRGDIHLQSVAAAGLHPLEAEIVSRGEPGAQLHGWPPPYPDPAVHAPAVAAADAETSRRMVGHYAVLDEDGFDAFAAAVRVLAAAPAPVPDATS